LTRVDPDIFQTSSKTVVCVCVCLVQFVINGCAKENSMINIQHG